MNGDFDKIKEQKKNQKKRRKKQNGLTVKTHSSFTTNKRLTTVSGLFSRGRTSLSILRDPAVSADIVARAEENLSAILKLTREDFNGVIRPPKDFEIHKQSCKFHHTTELPQTYGRGLADGCKILSKNAVPLNADDPCQQASVRNSSPTPSSHSSVQTPTIIRNHSLAPSPSPSEGQLERGKNASLSTLRDHNKKSQNLRSSPEPENPLNQSHHDQSEKLDIPYHKFKRSIRHSFNAAIKKLGGGDAKAELSQLLFDRYRHSSWHSSWQFTPPTTLVDSILGTSYSSDCNEASSFKRKRKCTASTSSSAVTPQFGQTFSSKICQNSKPVLESGDSTDDPELSKLKGDTRKESNSCCNTVPRNLFSQSPLMLKSERNSKSRSSRTPLTSLNSIYETSKTVAVNPMNYIEMYEKNRSNYSQSLIASYATNRNEGTVNNRTSKQVISTLHQQKGPNEFNPSFWFKDYSIQDKVPSLPTNEYQPLNTYNSTRAPIPSFPIDEYGNTSTNTGIFLSYPDYSTQHRPEPKNIYPGAFNNRSSFHQKPLETSQDPRIMVSSKHEDCNIQVTRSKASHRPFSQIMQPFSPQVYSPAIDASPVAYSKCRNLDLERIDVARSYSSPLRMFSPAAHCSGVFPDHCTASHTRVHPTSFTSR